MWPATQYKFPQFSWCEWNRSLRLTDLNQKLYVNNKITLLKLINHVLALRYLPRFFCSQWLLQRWNSKKCPSKEATRLKKPTACNWESTIGFSNPAFRTFFQLSTLVPEAFLYSLLANFATRTASFFYWHDALRAEKRKPLVATVGNLTSMPSAFDRRFWLEHIFNCSMRHMIGWIKYLWGWEWSVFVHLYGCVWRTFALSTDSLTREG